MSEQYMSMEEKLEKHDLEREEIFEKLIQKFEEDPKFLKNWSKGMNTQQNYFVSYSLEKDEFNLGSMPSNNWRSQAETANKRIMILNKDSSNQFSQEDEFTLEQLNYMLNEEREYYKKYDLLDEFNEEELKLLRKCDQYSDDYEREEAREIRDGAYDEYNDFFEKVWKFDSIAHYLTLFEEDRETFKQQLKDQSMFKLFR